MRAWMLGLVGGLLVAATVPAAVKTVWMSNAELTATFGGQNIVGEYENGETFQETYAADGAVSYRDALRTSGGCYRVRQASENCFEFHFVARTAAEAEKNPRTPDWTARGWFPDKPRTCIDGESV